MIIINNIVCFSIKGNSVRLSVHLVNGIKNGATYLMPLQ